MPLVTIALIGLNVIAYLLEIRHGGSFFGGPSPREAVRYGAIPYALTHPGEHCALVSATHPVAQRVSCRGGAVAAGSRPAWLTAFTSMFLHGSFLHIFGNMLFLAIFGPNVEDSMSRPRYLAFYLLGGLVALGAQVAIAPDSTVPTLGASGAIAAVLGGYILLFPRARVITLVLIVFFFTIVELPALVLLGLWFLEQLWFALAGLASPLGGSEGVAYFAHVGGFAFGMLAIRAFLTRRGSVPRPSVLA